MSNQLSKTKARKPFAVFDVDGTLFRWQLFHELIFELAHSEILPPDTEQKLLTAQNKWRNREHHDSFSEYELAVVDITIANLPGLSVDTFRRAGKRVIERSGNQLYTYTRDLAKSLQTKGYLLFIISGLFEEVVVPFAKQHHFDDWRSTTLEHKDGLFTGEANWMTHDGVHRKAECLHQMVEVNNATYEGSIAVGDTASDIQMMELVQQPIAFNPNPSLYRHAKSQGWKIVVERKNIAFEFAPGNNGEYVLQAP